MPLKPSAPLELDVERAVRTELTEIRSTHVASDNLDPKTHMVGEVNNGDSIAISGNVTFTPPTHLTSDRAR